MNKEHYDSYSEENGAKEIYVDETEQQSESEETTKKKASKINKWKLFKQAFGMVASGCASVVISRYLKENVPHTDSIAEKAVIGIGTYFITGIVSAKVAKYAEAELDEWKDSVIMIKDTVEEQSAEKKEGIE